MLKRIGRISLDFTANNPQPIAAPLLADKLVSHVNNKWAVTAKGEKLMKQQSPDAADNEPISL